MSVRAILILFYEEKPEELLDETDVDELFYRNIFDISQSQHRIARVSEGSNKKSLAIKLSQFCDIKTHQRYILREVKNCKRELGFSVNIVRDFLITFDKASRCSQSPLPKHKNEIGSIKSKHNLFAHSSDVIIEQPKRQIRLSFRFGKHNTCIFSVNCLNYTVFNLFIQKLSTKTIAKLAISAGTDLTLQTSVKLLRAITMCSAFTLDCRYGNSTIGLIGNVYCRNTKCAGKFCLHKKTFQPLHIANKNACNARLSARCAKLFLKIKKIPFSCRLVKWFTCLK